MVELVEVAEGVLEPSDHLGTHPDRFFFQKSFIKHISNYHFCPGYPTCPAAGGRLPPPLINEFRQFLGHLLKV